MKIIAYPLYAQAPDLQPAALLVDADRSENSTWLKSDQADNIKPALANAQRQGWQLLCPVAFRATWNGGPNPEGVGVQRFFQRMRGSIARNGHAKGQERTPQAASPWALQLKNPPPVSCICPT